MNVAQELERYTFQLKMEIAMYYWFYYWQL